MVIKLNREHLFNMPLLVFILVVTLLFCISTNTYQPSGIGYDRVYAIPPDTTGCTWDGSQWTNPMGKVWNGSAWVNP